jgi:sialic acid synthase SpsE
LDKPLLVAELGINHGGDVDKAVRMGKAAARAGADAVKLQYYHESKLLAYRRGRGAAVTEDQARLLGTSRLSLGDIQRVRDAVYPTPVFASVFDPDDLQPYKAAGFNWVKLSVEQAQRPEMLSGAVACGFNRIFASVSNSRVDVFDKWWDWVRRPFTLLYCPTGYPVCSSADLRLRAVRDLHDMCVKGLTVWRVGLSLHPSEDLNVYNAFACAYGAGANVFELHYRLEGDEDCAEKAWSVDDSELYTIRALLCDLYSMCAGRSCDTVRGQSGV